MGQYITTPLAPDNITGDVEPLEDRVLVEPDTLPECTPSGLLVLARPLERDCIQVRTGVVMAVGPGRTTDHGSVVPMHVAVGDRVIYGKFLGMPFRWRGVEVIMCQEPELLAVVRA